MNIKYIPLILLILMFGSVHAQRKSKATNVDTILSNYQPADLFSPMFYSEKGNEFHAPTGDPGPKYWQNRVNYHIKAAIDTVTKNLTATETIDYINNSPDALQFLWLQLDQNTFKRDARSNFYTDLIPAANNHTDGYQIESVSISEGSMQKHADFIITDTRMQIRLANALKAGATIKLTIKYHYTIPAVLWRTHGLFGYQKRQNIRNRTMVPPNVRI